MSVASVLPHVLIVDDDDMIRTLHKKFLEHAGFATTLAEDAEAALRILASAQPDAVLLDMMMPGMSGPDLLRLMRARAPLNELPVVMLTADDQPESIEDGFAAGATDYLTKPVDRRILAARLFSAIEARKDKTRLGQIAATERERDRMRAELEQGRSLQRAQLAQMPQEHRDWSLTGVLRPCHEVGGDMFDVVADATSTTLVMIDVSGHGLSSAMVASSVRSMIRLALRRATLAEAVSLVSDHLANDEAGHYACIALIRLEGARVTVLNAGLPPIAVVDRSSGTILQSIGGAGIPPGLMAGETYDVVTFDVEAGTRLVVCSDGLTEPFGATDAIEAAVERLELAKDQSIASLEERLQRLLGFEQSDDATLAIADFKGTSS